jgi:hypothetical protein
MPLDGTAKMIRLQARECIATACLNLELAEGSAAIGPNHAAIVAPALKAAKEALKRYDALIGYEPPREPATTPDCEPGD